MSDNSQKVIILQGLPGCGKSTWAEQECKRSKGRIKRINKDLLRRMIDFSQFSKENEFIIRLVRDILLERFLGEGFSVIIDDTNLDQAHIKQIEKIAQKAYVQTEVNFFDVPLETCIQRDLGRMDSVGERVIRNMYNKYLRPTYHHPKSSIDPLPEAIICDLDGTLALMNGRHPFEFETCDKDIPRQVLVDLLLGYYLQAKYIIFLTGRYEQHRETTQSWIDRVFKNQLIDCELIMRANDDNRHDYIMKEEVYNNRIRDRFDVKLVFEDRPQAADMWRRIGLTCMLVDDTWF